MARTVGEGGNPSLHVVTASPETLVHKRSSVCWAHFSYASQSADMQEDRITNPYIYIFGEKETDYIRAKSCLANLLEIDMKASSPWI